MTVETETESEATCRARLGAPAGADRVMVVTESTHWDPNWLFTSKEYFRFNVARTIDLAIEALLADPRRVFSLECVFFADLYWTSRPQKRDVFRSLVNEGRLRFTGSGVTTPDTLLPEDELLVRDLLIGQEWLRSRGMTREPRMLYLPDSFGHSPGVPSLLHAAGLPYAAICRIDGMRFPGADMESAKRFPRPGTSAELLLDEGTADFIWRGPDGSEVLTHWMTYGYGHGDMIASGGLSRALGLPTAWRDRRDRHVTARIEGYIGQLARVAATPYLLLGIGFDFVRPVPRLVELLDRWNEAHFPRTGVWMVNAGIDDYLDLVSHHRERLPTLALDPNPYWMGFYSSRPDIKRACRQLGRELVQADNERARADLAPGLAPRAMHPRGDAERSRAWSLAWWRAVTSNHHDFVTGTAPDRVARGEQARWLREAFDSIAVGRHDDAHPRAGGEPAVDGPDAGAPAWDRDGPSVTVTTASLRAVFDEHRGGALVSLTAAGGTELLRAPSLELRSHAESGGLWRMGHEFNGGRWALRDLSTDHRAEVSVHRDPAGGCRVHIDATLDGCPAAITVLLDARTVRLTVHTSIDAPARRTVTMATHQVVPIAGLSMHQPGGMVIRDLRRWYSPTFWPLHSFATALPATDDSSSPLQTVATAVPTAMHATRAGRVETVVARTAFKELAFGAMPVLAPAWGRRWRTQRADLAVEWSRGGGPEDRTTAGRSLSHHIDQAVGRTRPAWIVDVDDPMVEVIAVKPADRGEGTIVRLRSWATGAGKRSVTLRFDPAATKAIAKAWRTDALERDLAPLAVHAGEARLDVEAHLTTVRLSAVPMS